jgi:two-component system response regulator MprA
MSVQPLPSQSAVRLLLIEDDPNVTRMVRDGLESDGYSLEDVSSIEAARRRLNANAYDALLLDLSLPDGDGLELAASIRAAGDDTPIIMLTARSTVAQRIDGFASGADDYLCKPFAVEELAARLQAVVRRSGARSARTLQYADLQLDLLSRTVRRDDLEATLSARETDLLVYFINHADEIIPRQRLLEEVWGASAENDSNVLNVYVNYLRNKIERGRYSRLIHTVRGVGFLLSTHPPAD